MLKKIGEFLGLTSDVDFQDLIKKRATIVDVRTQGEYVSGHLKGSINIPLQELSKSLARIDKSRPVIVCCASGMRSSTAKSVLKGHGFDVHNGGGWQSLQHKIK